MKFALPLRVMVSKRKHFILNLNNYRNAHHRVLSAAKRNYAALIFDLGLPKVQYDCIRAHYKIYPASNRIYDGNNPVCIIDKFLMDSLVTMEIIPDDNIRHVKCYTWEPMEVDRDNPRVEVYIENLSCNRT